MAQQYPYIKLKTNLSPKVFGCTTYVHRQNPGNKLNPKAVKCAFVGYSKTQKSYKCHHPR